MTSSSVRRASRAMGPEAGVTSFPRWVRVGYCWMAGFRGVVGNCGHELGMLQHLLGISSGNASNLMFLDHDLFLSHGKLFLFVIIGTGTKVIGQTVESSSSTTNRDRQRRPSSEIHNQSSNNHETCVIRTAMPYLLMVDTPMILHFTHRGIEQL